MNETQADRLLRRVGEGRLSEEKLRIACLLGHAPARAIWDEAYGTDLEADFCVDGDWLANLHHWASLKVVAHTAVAVARHVLHAWEGRGKVDRRLRELIVRVETWIARPGLTTTEAVRELVDELREDLPSGYSKRKRAALVGLTAGEVAATTRALYLARKSWARCREEYDTGELKKPEWCEQVQAEARGHFPGGLAHAAKVTSPEDVRAAVQDALLSYALGWRPKTDRRTREAIENKKKTRKKKRKKKPAGPWGSRNLVEAAERLRDEVGVFTDQAPFGDAEFVLNPLDYAWKIHASYLRRYGPKKKGRVEAVLVGMNPGVWGMTQTGIPFGSPDMVRDFLQLSGRVVAPERAHPTRPIRGLESPQQEVSGRRLWGGIRDCFGTPEAFFSRFFVLNYCPLVFLSATGANIPNAELPAAVADTCMEACDLHMLDALTLLQPRTAIGVGKWAEKKLKNLVKARGLDIATGTILSPSPASPTANRGWLAAAKKQLEALDHPWP